MRDALELHYLELVTSRPSRMNIQDVMLAKPQEEMRIVYIDDQDIPKSIFFVTLESFITIQRLRRMFM